MEEVWQVLVEHYGFGETLAIDDSGTACICYGNKGLGVLVLTAQGLTKIIMDDDTLDEMLMQIQAKRKGQLCA